MLLIPAGGEKHAHSSQRDHVVVEDILPSLDINDFTSLFIVFSEFTLMSAYQRTSHH